MTRELAERPLVIAFLGVTIGLSSAWNWTNALFALILVPVLWSKKPTLAVLCTFLAIGILARPHLEPKVTVSGGHLSGTVEVIAVPSTERDSQLAIVEYKGKRYRLRLPEESTANLGDKLFLSARVLPLGDSVVRQRLEVADLRPTRPVQLVSDGFVLWKWGSSFRRSFLTFVEANSDPRTVGMVEALALNVTGDLGNGTYDDLRRSGTIHVVSASGLHVTLVAVALTCLLICLPVPRLLQLSLLCCCLLVYAAAAGCHPPMFRSVVMVLTYALAYLFSREPDALSALALSGIANLAFEPEAVGNIGFQLSYIAVAALILFGRANPCSTVRDTVLSTAQTGLIAFLATAPLLALNFGQIPLTSVLANLLIAPSIPIVVVGSLASFLMSFVVPLLGVGAYKVIVEPMVGWVMACVHSLGSPTWSVLQTPSFSPYWIALVYFLFASLYRFKRREATD